MKPEETAQAAIDVQAVLFMPIHWGSFSLALHDWDDPVVRVTKKADELGIPVTVPVIGEEIGLDHLPVNSFKWWNEQ
jgi:L-ascorbate metabolism protein UlaG (beta-lactamase superfamily)